jgi:hypothetical protein
MINQIATDLQMVNFSRSMASDLATLLSVMAAKDSPEERKPEFYESVRGCPSSGLRLSG